MTTNDNLRAAIMQALTPARVLDFYKAEGLQGINFTNTDGDGKDQYMALCPFTHESGGDSKPSFSFTTSLTGGYHCFACGLKGDLFTFYMRKHQAEYKDAAKALADWLQISVEAGRARPAPLTPAGVDEWARRLQQDEPGLLGELERLRGLSKETLAKWKIGYDGSRITIPVADETGEWVNVRRYKLHSERGQNKMLNYSTGYGEALLFPLSALEARCVLLCEGEWDTLVTQQAFDRVGGGPIERVITHTTGVGHFQTSWINRFVGKVVYICFDNDPSGQAGAERVAGFLRKVATVYVINLPDAVGSGGDLTDFFVTLGRDWNDFLTHVQDAHLIPSETAEDVTDEDPPIDVLLGEASAAHNMGKRLRFKGFVSGKDSEPYGIPLTIGMTCAGDARQCPICPWENKNEGQRRLTAKERGTLQMIGVNDVTQVKAQRTLLGIPDGCGRHTLTRPDSQNIEELRVITDIDTSGSGAEQDIVDRRVFVRAHGVAANRPYYFQGYTWADPKDQHNVHLIDVVEPAEDAITGFTLTPERVEQIRAEFGVRSGETPGTAAKRRSLQMAWHVHGIHGRSSLQLAYDITFHSVLSFNLGRRYVRKGWCECMVVGDSAQGKSEMIIKMMQHYRTGERVGGENVTSAGILGGLTKMGDRWILTWGKIPQNDRRLLCLDEVGDMAVEIIAGLSDLRSSGTAEINKIRVEKVPARCRLIWLGNPRDGKSLIQYDTPITALKSLIGKNEDARRLDYAMCVRSNEVDDDIINRAQATPPVPLTATSELCRDLVLWSWSRTSDQVRITVEAQDEIEKQSRIFGRMYHSSFPLVESADQRTKFARMACGLAAMTFSTPDGETLVVEPRHVQDVATFLHKVYDDLGYTQYSLTMAQTNDMDEERFTTTLAELCTTHNWDLVVTTLTGPSPSFNKKELQEMTGLTGDQADVLIRRLTLKRLINRGRWGYMKNPAFITLLNREQSRLLKTGIKADVESQQDPLFGGIPDY